MLISRTAVAAYQSRQFDNWAWLKSVTARDLHAELCRLRVMPYFKTEPWLHQLVCFYIGIHRPDFLYLLDMGTGKSKVIIDLITQARRDCSLRRALVLVPRVINMESWRDDILRHSDLEPNPANTSSIEEKWERLANPQGDVTMIDYAGLHLALSRRGKTGRKLVPDETKVRAVQKLYNFVAVDESHKLANDQSLWFALVRRLTKSADRVYAATGTLFGKQVEHVWPQFYLVDGGHTFGENLGLFRASFFKAEPNKWGRGEKYTFDPGTESKLHEMIGHRSIRYGEDEVLDLPARVMRTERYEMGEEQRFQYMRALEGLINSDTGDLEERKMQYVKMRQITSGYLAWRDDHGDHVLRFKSNPKLDGLEALVDAMAPGDKAVIPYVYTETGRMICDRIAAMGIGLEWFYGGTPDKVASRRRFMTDPGCRVMVMNAEAGGTGNDGLQTVARYMFIYETPTSPVTRQQTVKRIHRSGMGRRAFFYDMVMRRSLDASILADIEAAQDTYDAIVNGRPPPKSFFLGG